MHKKSTISKALAGSFMAATMLAPTVANVAMNASAAELGMVIGESDFTNKALPWHTCESSPAKQNFSLKDKNFHIEIIVADGADGDKWDLQFRHRNLNLHDGHEYEIGFKAKASRSGFQLCSKIGDIGGEEEYVELFKDGTMGAGPDMGGQWGSPMELGTDWTTVTGSFKANKDLEGVEWAFHYANATTNPTWGGNAKDGDELWFDDMILKCKTCGSTYKEGSCLADPKNSFGATNRTYGAIAVDESTYMPGGTLVNYISVNQVGYYPELQKIATLSDNAGDILPNKQSIKLSGTYDFEVINASTGKVVYTGTSSAPMKDDDSADTVCKLDFSEVKEEGEYYIKIKGEDWRSFTFGINNNVYYDKTHRLLTNAMNYFYQNRSGADIEEKYITSGDKSTLAHKGGHKTDKATIQNKWQNEYSSKDQVTTLGCGSLTANGGWYDAGDHGKYVVNGGISVWTLQNMYERAILFGTDKTKFDDGSGTVVIPENGNKVPDVLDECAYELDFIAQMKVTSSDTHWGKKYEGLYYHKLHDHKWTGLATKPWDYEEEWGTVRIVKPPTFAATLNYAACAAQAARLWEPYDSKKASTYLESAKEAYQAYKKTWYEYDSSEIKHSSLDTMCPAEEENDQSLYAPMWHAKGGGPYGDNYVGDDDYWAACEIYASCKAMGDKDADTYYEALKGYKDAFKAPTRIVGGENQDGSFTLFNWGNTGSCGTLTLLLHKDMVTDSEYASMKESLLETADKYVDMEDQQGYGIPYIYDGKPYNDPNNLDPKIMIQGYEWGSNSMVINNCIAMAYAYDLSADKKYLNGVVTGLDYLFGNNPLTFSFVTGYGLYKEKAPHHRYWSYELDKTLPMAPDGVLSGGPNAGLQDPYVRALSFVPGDTSNPSQRCFVDSIEAWSTNEVTINWNAPLAWIASYMEDEATNKNKETIDGSSGKTPDPTKPTDNGGSSDGKVSMWGDANVDGEVSIADATAILQSIGSPDVYKLSDQGKLNADVVDNGKGVTGTDALAIQAKDAGLIKESAWPMTSAELDAVTK